MTPPPMTPSQAPLETRLIKLDSVQDTAFLEAALLEAATLLRAGELVAFPTETVYGLGADATNARAVAKIFEAKGRPATDPVIVHVADVSQVAQVAAELSPLAEQVLRRFTPGPLTVLLPRNQNIPPLVSAGLTTVGVRIPAHPVAQALIRRAGVPIAAPSANRFAHISPTRAQQVYDDLAGRIPLILDDGQTTIGVESTIVDLTSSPPRLLRPGGVTVEQLRDLIPDLVVVERFASASDGALEAPGMLLRHYAPQARLLLFEGAFEAVLSAIRLQAGALNAAGERVGLLVCDEDLPSVTTFESDRDSAVMVESVGPYNDLAAVARGLYTALRALDARQPTVILARSYPTHGIGLAIRDRMVRAAEGRLIRV